MRVILSRKGFDKGSGGNGSPLIIDEGLLYSIPIPDKYHQCFHTYHDLRLNEHLSCYGLMEQLSIPKTIRDLHCHADPDIRRSLFYHSDQYWRPMLGQQGLPEAHLEKQGVSKGDLFLFYGLFRDVKRTQGKYSFSSPSFKQVIWGYLQVGGEPLPVIDNPMQLLHPHYYACHAYSVRDRNTVYPAADTLSFAPNLPGFGTFTYSNDLMLSAHASERAETYNLFRLPSHFFYHRMTGHSNETRWCLDGKHCYLHAANRGQEFILGESIEAEEWAMNLIKAHAD